MKIIDSVDNGNTIRYWIHDEAPLYLSERTTQHSLMTHATIAVNMTNNQIMKCRYPIEEVAGKAMSVIAPDSATVEHMMQMAQSAGIAVGTFIAQHQSSFIETFEPAHASELLLEPIRVELSANLIHYRFSTLKGDVERYIDHYSFRQWADSVNADSESTAGFYT